jgi:hypothetical protein
MARLGVGNSAIHKLAFSLHDDLNDSDAHVATVMIGGAVAPRTPVDPAQADDADPSMRWHPRPQAAKSSSRSSKLDRTAASLPRDADALTAAADRAARDASGLRARRSKGSTGRSAGLPGSRPDAHMHRLAGQGPAGAGERLRATQSSDLSMRFRLHDSTPPAFVGRPLMAPPASLTT